MIGIALDEHVLAHHPTCLAHIQLRRQMVRVGELVATPTPLASFVAKPLGDRGVILQKVQQPDLVAHMFGKHRARVASSPVGHSKFFPGNESRTRPRDTSLMSYLPLGSTGS